MSYERNLEPADVWDEDCGCCDDSCPSDCDCDCACHDDGCSSCNSERGCRCDEAYEQWRDR